MTDDSALKTGLLEVSVSSEARSYPIVTQAGLLKTLGPLLAQHLRPNSKVLIVTDAIVAGLYLAEVQQSLESRGFEVAALILPAGEATKTLSSAQAVWQKALAFGLTRHDAMVALGGGVIGDLTGFCAASYYRGLAFVQVPTTLLAQVDSSVGGKVAVNLPFVDEAGAERLFKNGIGAFYQPILVAMDPETLTSLPKRELLAGLAEVFKYALIEKTACQEPETLVQPSLWDYFKTQKAQWQSQLPWLLQRCCAIKATVVKRDERETLPENDPTGRVCLNLGHSFAHALEAVAHQAEGTEAPWLLHGEAVALGLRLACRLAERLQSVPAGFGAEVEAMMDALNLQKQAPVELLAKTSPQALLALMGKDKKNVGNRLRLILPEQAPGQIKVETQAPEAAVLASLQTLWD